MWRLFALFIGVWAVIEAFAAKRQGIGFHILYGIVGVWLIWWSWTTEARRRYRQQLKNQPPPEMSPSTYRDLDAADARIAEARRELERRRQMERGDQPEPS
jgi:hypothetical protein